MKTAGVFFTDVREEQKWKKLWGLGAQKKTLRVEALGKIGVILEEIAEIITYFLLESVLDSFLLSQ